MLTIPSTGEAGEFTFAPGAESAVVSTTLAEGEYQSFRMRLETAGIWA